MLFFVDLIEGLDKGAVEFPDDQDGQDAQTKGNTAIERYKIEHGADGNKKLCDRIDIHESVVKEIPEGLIRFANAVDGCATMVVLLPFDGQVEHLVIFFLEKIPAHVEGKAAFHDAGRAVEAPPHEFDAGISHDVEKGIV